MSKGGSSLISCWALLAYIKASDTRQNASFALGRHFIRSEEEEVEEEENDEEYDEEYDEEFEDEYEEEDDA